MAGHWDEKAVFTKAVELQGEARASFLAEACPTPEARERIESLLRHHETRSEALFDEGTRTNVQPSGVAMPEAIDEFRFISRIGEGGMGIVYLAEDTILGRRVALKVLARQFVGSERALARFREEARNAAALDHPGIVPVFKFAVHNGTYYLVSEFVDGPTLASIIADERTRRRQGTRSGEARAWHKHVGQVIAQIADALEASHRAGIIHRDVKPSNILMDAQRGARLTDFGIAVHQADLLATGTTGAVGSCHYMSPEQAAVNTSKIDRRSDVFSMGVVMYEMLALQRPFDGQDFAQVVRAVIAAQPARLRTLDRHIPIDLETICHIALEKDPTRRYPTAAHMAADLRCFLAGEPIMGRPPSLGRRIRERLRRNRRAIAIASIIVLGVVSAGLAYEIREMRLRGMGRLSIIEIGADGRPAAGLESRRIFVRPWDEMGRVLGPHREIGPLPLKHLALRPGLYRITIIGGHLVEPSTLEFAEFDETIVAGKASTRSVRLVATDQVRQGMVECNGGVHTVDYHDQVRGAPISATAALSPFLIDEAEVTNAEYRRFVSATGHTPPWYWSNPAYSEALEDRPVTYVTRDDCIAYALWAGKRLPTVEEWIAAAQAPDARRVPWGDGAPPPEAIPSPEALVVRDSADEDAIVSAYARFARPARSVEAARTASGLYHMFGNVWETLGTSINVQGGWQGCMIGADWTISPANFDLSIVGTHPIDSGSPRIGFRCVRGVAPNLPP